MEMAVVSDLVAGIGDALDHVGVAFGSVTGNVEGGRDVMSGEQIEDAGGAANHAKTPFRQGGEPALVLGPFAEVASLGISVEGERDGHLSAVGPAGKREGTRHESYLLEPDVPMGCDGRYRDA